MLHKKNEWSKELIQYLSEDLLQPDPDLDRLYY